LGERASDRVYSMSNKEAQQWLDVHMHRADLGEWVFYVTAAIAAAALVVPRFRPRTQLPLALATLVFALASLGRGRVDQSSGREGAPFGIPATARRRTRCRTKNSIRGQLAPAASENAQAS
jgi:hypothetical protein